MPVVTIEGRAGSGAPDLGRLVARQLGVDFVDRLLLAEIARRIGSSVQAVVETERRSYSAAARLSRFVQRMLERSAVAGSGGDPYFGPGIDTLLARPYREIEEPIALTPQILGEREFREATAEVITDIAETGSVVILSRGGGAILKDRPDVLRVGVVADLELRVRKIMARERLDMAGAQKFIQRSDRAQAHYFERSFGTSPLDPFLYHVIVNTSHVGVEYAARLVVEMARALANHDLK